MDIIIFCGQSNMQGQSERLSSDETVAGAYEYKFITDSLDPLKNPVGEDITNDKKAGAAIAKGTDLSCWLRTHVTGSSCYGHTNLVPEFCREYVSTTGSEATAVHVAKGSTTISYWLPRHKGYRILVEKATAAIEKVKKEHSIGRIFFVWLQGESDAIEGNSGTYYKQMLEKLSASLKKKINIEKFCIIRVGKFTNDERDWEIITAQDEICAENSDFLMLTDIATSLNEKAEYMNPHVAGHYSAKGLETLGAAAGKALGVYALKK